MSHNSLVRAQIAIENDGQSVAEGVTLRLTLPDGVAAGKDEDDLSMTPPPKDASICTAELDTDADNAAAHNPVAIRCS